MSEQGRTILARMLEIIEEYKENRTNLRRLTDELGALYDALPADAQPPEREWSQAFVPLDRLNSDRAGEDVVELAGRIDTSLGKLEGLITTKS